MIVPQSVYSFIYLRMPWLFPFLVIVNKDAINIHVQIFVVDTNFRVIWESAQEHEVLWKITELSPQWPYCFAFLLVVRVCLCCSASLPAFGAVRVLGLYLFNRCAGSTLYGPQESPVFQPSPLSVSRSSSKSPQRAPQATLWVWLLLRRV